jgi:hypothetical protein
MEMNFICHLFLFSLLCFTFCLFCAANIYHFVNYFAIIQSKMIKIFARVTNCHHAGGKYNKFAPV